MERMREIEAQGVHIVAVNGDKVGTLKAVGSGGGVPAYRGPTEYAPCDHTVVVPVKGYRMKENIIIDPVPSNYGRLIWNGHTLTVY